LKTALSTRLVGERVALRPPRTSDIPGLRRLLADNAAHLRPWSPAAASGQDPLSLVEITRTITSQRRAWKEDRTYALLIEAPETDALIGRVVLSEVARGPFQNAYLGYWIDHRWQGKGLTTEAVRLTTRFAFDVLGLHRVQAAVIPHNVASRRVLSKLGYREEGIAQRYLSIAGAWQDHVIYAITREDALT
jgi:ribosomal-protein-alanine N-acetyltransferase